MVAHDPIRKRTLSAHPDFDDGKDGAERWSDPHVGSTVRVKDDEPQEAAEPVAGRSTSEAPKSSSKKKG